VINAPALATQQYGQRKLIEDLFEILADAASTPDFGVFPPRFRELLESGTSDREISRVVADYISGMTEREAIELHQRLTGASLGSVLDPFSP
jgi:dGTPase